MTPPRLCRRLAYVVATLATGCLIVAAGPHRAWAAGDDAQARADQCSAIPPGTGHPPVNLTPVTLQLLQRSVEPVPATDGLIHLVYAAQVTNTQTMPADILSVVPVDALAKFTPTGRNFVTDEQGRDVTGQVRLLGASPGDTLPADGPQAEPVPSFTTRMPAGSTGLMFFDVTYTDPAQIPRQLAHAITLASPGGGPAAPGLTNPVPVGCRPLAVLQPPLVGHGWVALNGCCSFAAYHRDVAAPINGTLQLPEQFAIDYIQIGPNNAFVNGPPQVLTSWWGYNTPVLAAAPGVVVEVVDGMPDQQPVGTITNITVATFAGNSVIVDIGGGQYVLYAHLKPGTIPARVRKGARLSAGNLIGRVGNSGNTDAPHLHFQVMDSPSPLDATGLPFVFDSQLLEGSVSESEGDAAALQGAPLTIDPTGAGPRRDLMPARDQVFGYNLSQ